MLEDINYMKVSKLPDMCINFHLIRYESLLLREPPYTVGTHYLKKGGNYFTASVLIEAFGTNSLTLRL
jgi:hypothetical protein